MQQRQHGCGTCVAADLRQVAAGLIKHVQQRPGGRVQHVHGGVPAAQDQAAVRGEAGRVLHQLWHGEGQLLRSTNARPLQWRGTLATGL